MDQLDQFIKDIIDAKKLPGITDEAKAGLLEEMRDGLLDKINRALIEALPEEKVNEFNQLLDTPDVSDEQVQLFIEQSGVDTQKVTAQAMLEFRNLYLQGSAEREAA
ncbi:TPA: hypothetical protein DD425_01810 [Candidatus Saccharibacteria bacterium]|nr:hypothetical protein [Candidatus Saccharibacteria bacterium]|tara:strand:+ start:1930 stop:2250 length:321 start_codon:yes stop_codon:yes gene_type:complete